MPAESTHGDIHTGDVSGTFVVGDNNRVTNTMPHPEPHQPQQQSSAKDGAAAFAVQHGTMYVTYNAEADPEAQG
jgi:alkanesulfonate monooxygenase SsuD/methylene tetrahydromethanopterin reductase-like flavin-dependent oxidoreductase (luciferase family)